MEDSKRNDIANNFDNDDQYDLEVVKNYLKKYDVKDRLMTDEELPATDHFDLTCSLSNNVKDFGICKNFDKVGWAVKYTGNIRIKIADGNFLDMNNVIGFIVGESNNRVIIQTDHGYFGWLRPEEYSIINLVYSSYNTSYAIH